MQVLYPHCAGLDVHKKVLVACRIIPDEQGNAVAQTRRFSTMTDDLLALSEWLTEGQITHVAMESTGEYWKPVYNILEGCFELLVVNAQHIKHVPGRKTDVKDAEWIAQLLQLGLLRPSFIPPPGQRELRELTRHRTGFIQERARLINRIQKVLESANIKLACVATNVLGVSGRAILDALIQGQDDAAFLAELARGRMRSKRADLERALTGYVREHHRFLLCELLCQIDSLDETIARFDEQIGRWLAPFAESVALLDTIPGIAQEAAETIVAELGQDMARFPTARHLAAWAGVAPGNHESAGKRLSSRIRSGNRTLRATLTQAAHAAARSKDTYLSSLFHRLASRRGKKRAIMAVAHSMVVAIYYMLSRRQPYQELGPGYLDQLKPEAVKRRLIGRLEGLGYTVMVEPKQAVTA
jgi:transposase